MKTWTKNLESNLKYNECKVKDPRYNTGQIRVTEGLLIKSNFVTGREKNVKTTQIYNFPKWEDLISLWNQKIKNRHCT